MKVAICTVGVYDPPLEPHADYVKMTNQLKYLYCEKHGHAFVRSDENPRPGRTGHWSKFPALLYALKKLGVDWAIWMDCDAAPVNFKIDVADMLARMEPDKVVIQKDILGWNSGVFAVPNTEKAVHWLVALDSEQTHDSFKSAPFFDQDAIAASFETEHFVDFQQNPPPEFGFNQFEDIYQWYGKSGLSFPNEYIPGRHWCLHIPGYGNAYRRIRFEGILLALDKAPCPVCGSFSEKYFSVDFDKTFYEPHPDMALQGGECDYHLCLNCDFIFAPMFSGWTDEMYKSRIYNGDYEKYVDTAHVGDDRAEAMLGKFGRMMVANEARHLDYGGANGQFARLVREKTGLWSDSYDPFYGDGGRDFKFPSKYNLITAFDVLEHIYDPNIPFADFNRLLTERGVVLTSTQNWTAIEELRYTLPTKWETVAPRNGHVCVYGQKTFEYLAARHGFRYRADRSTGYFQIFEKTRQSEPFFRTTGIPEAEVKNRL